MITPINFECKKPKCIVSKNNNISFHSKHNKNKRNSNTVVIIALGALALGGFAMVKRNNTKISNTIPNKKVSTPVNIKPIIVNDTIESKFSLEKSNPLKSFIGETLKKDGENFEGELIKTAGAFSNAQKTTVVTNWKDGLLKSFEIRDNETNKLLASSTSNCEFALYKNSDNFQDYTINPGVLTKHLDASQPLQYETYFTRQYDYNYNPNLFELSDEYNKIKRDMDFSSRIIHSYTDYEYSYEDAEKALYKNIPNNDKEPVVIGIPLELLFDSKEKEFEQASAKLKPLFDTMQHLETETGAEKLQNNLNKTLEDIRSTYLSKDEQNVELKETVSVVFEKICSIIKSSILG